MGQEVVLPSAWRSSVVMAPSIARGLKAIFELIDSTSALLVVADCPERHQAIQEDLEQFVRNAGGGRIVRQDVKGVGGEGVVAAFAVEPHGRLGGFQVSHRGGDDPFGLGMRFDQLFALNANALSVESGDRLSLSRWVALNVMPRMTLGNSTIIYVNVIAPSAG